ncbi:MAG TPA: AsmA family protein [Gammaproteobacteria bacterium]|nr:AsmA family protein [Gammaproteobacteria bacterium]
MARGLKIFGIVAGVVLGLVVLAMLLVALFFDPNDYKDDIAAAAEEETGRELSIDGDLSLSLFPWLAIGVGHATLSNAPGFGDEPFAEIDGASLSLRLLPLLLRREIEIGTVRLDGLSLDLQVDANGRSNWEDLADDEAPEPAPEEEGAPPSISVHAVEVSDARVSYTDAAAGTRYVLEDFDFETGTLEPGEPFEVVSSFAIESSEPALRAQVRLDTRAAVDIENGRFTLEAPQLDLEVSGEAVPGEDAMQIAVAADAVAIDTEAQTLALDALVVKLPGLEARVQASGTRIVDAPQVTGELVVPEFSPRELLSALDMPLETADPGALGAASLEAKIAYGEDGLALDDLGARLDDTRITGELRMPAAEDAPLRFAFTVDAIDLDRYLPPEDEDDAGADDAAAPIDDVEIPVDTLRGLLLDGSLEIGEVVLSEMRLQNVRLVVRSDGGTLRLHPLEAGFYGGRYVGDIRLDVAASPPRVSLDEHVEGIQVGALTRDMYELERISGTASGDLVLSAAGANVGQMRRTLDGTVKLALAEGAIEGIDIWHEIRKARALIPGQPAAPGREGPPRTEVTELRASGTVDKGILHNDDLVAKLPFLNVTGQGDINLPEATVDYRLRATVVSKPELEAQTGALGGKTIPVAITGTLSEIKVRPDVSAALKQEARDRVEREILERLGDDDEKDAAGDEPAGERDLEQELEDKAKKKFKDLWGD